MRSTITMGLAVLLAMGCDGGEVDTDAAVLTDAGGDVDAGRDAGRDAGMTGDGNNTFATADTITIDPAALTEGVVSPAGDLDYYTFEGTAGQWVQILTVANADDDPTMVDTVITLYDDSMTQIAENDDSVPRVNTDSELITRLPATGTYYLLVQEFSTWVDDPPEGMSSFMYELGIFEVDPTVAGWNVDAEGGDDVASAQALGEGAAGTGAFSVILGDFNDATDVDVYTITIPAGLARSYSVTLMPSGPMGYGSTATPARLWITNADGTQIIARINPAQVDAIEPSLTEGTYLLFVEHGTAGANDFYVLKAFRGTENTPETDDVLNNLTATADPLTFAAPVDGTRSSFALAHVGGDTVTPDTDHFSMAVMTGEAVTVVCGSATSGSGVQGLTAALLGSDGTTLLMMDVETATTGVEIQYTTAATADTTYYLRLTKTGQDAEVTGDWVRCGIHLAPPTP